jgi:hypothetical protein
MILFLAAPAAAGAHGLSVQGAGAAMAQREGAATAQRAAFAIPRPGLPLRDVVRAAPGAAAARIAATASGQRYALNDGSDGSIAVEATATCQAECNAADPQAIAATIGTFIHGPEVNLLTVQLDTPFQLGFECGFDAQACYFGGEDKIVISGNDDPAPDGAGREFVLAHEYGHHIAQHRDLPAPFPAAIDWGTERWSSIENVCGGYRAGHYFPGDEARDYYEDPGEAFAETFAFNRFPETAVEWAWTPSLRPSPASFRALRRDTLRPWRGRSSFTISGRVPRSGAIMREFRTPFDGRVSIGPVGERGLGYELTIRNRSGKALRSSRQGVSSHHRLDYTVCGQLRLRVAVRATGRPGKRFELTVQRP